MFLLWAPQKDWAHESIMGQKLSSAHFGSISNTIIPGPLHTHTHTQRVVGLKRKKKKKNLAKE
jgi:hypothetical protein